MAVVVESGGGGKRSPKTGLLRVVLAGIVALLMASGWVVSGSAFAYIVAGSAGLLGVALLLGRPLTLSQNALALVFLDSVLVSGLVFDTGGGGSPFFPLYLLASFGLLWAPGAPSTLAGAAAVVVGYLVATAGSSGTLEALFSQNAVFKGGLIVLFCVLVRFLGTELRDLRETSRNFSLAATTVREGEERIATLSSRLTPVLRILDVGGVLDWLALTVRELLDAPFVHVALLEGGNHRTSAEGSSDVYPSWWHPEIQRILLWSSRTGEVLREETTVCGMERLVAVPIVSREGHGLGALVVGGRALDVHEERYLKLLAAEAASVVQDAEDAPGGREPVSRLPNQTSLQRVIEREISGGNAITLLMIQVNHLREYRQAYGITAEARLFEKIGTLLNEEHQRVFHYGNALVVVLRGSSKSRSQRAALRVQQTITALTGDAAVSLDASVGFVLISSEETEDTDTILDAAANAVSRAKTEPGKHFGAPLDEVLKAMRNLGVGAREEGTVQALLEATRLREPYLGVHMRAVSQLSVKIGAEMGLSREQLDTLGVGALLHDVGKIGIPDAILQKPGPLTCNEYETMKSHTNLGAEILEGAGLPEAVPAAKHHHERFEGGGYPDELEGENIPLVARIVCVADALDSMVRDKAYLQGVSEQAALDEIMRNSGTQFDPQVVEALLAVLQRGNNRRMDSAN